MGEIFQNFHSRTCTHWDTNFKEEKRRVCKGSIFDFFKFMPLMLPKTDLTDFPEKLAPTKVKYLLTVCQILQNFTKANLR